MTTADDLALASLEEAGRLVEKKEVSPVELTQRMLDRIERLDPKLNAYMTVTADQALEDARMAEREIAAGKYAGPLHGIPVAVKDLFQTKGVRTTAGSKILDTWQPDEDATAVRKLREAGAVNLGKLGMHEWAFGITSDNIHFGPVRNPWETDHVPGGSSGGSGVATAAGLAYATLGSDTGGSIRIPASFCGCVGLMPTYGRASLYGAVPLSWSLDHAGPLTRTVRDAAIVLRAISGVDPRDPNTADEPVPDWLAAIERGARGLRIGVPKTYFWENLDPQVERACRKALTDLEAAGAVLREIDIPGAQALMGPGTGIMFAEAAAYHSQHFPARRDEYSAGVAALLDAGLGVKAPDYVQSIRLMQDLRSGVADSWLDNVDVMACPTIPIPAPSIEASRKEEMGFRVVAFTAIIDLTGQPAISVPCGLTPENLPVGLMFTGRRWDEGAVVWAGRAYEQVRGPFPAPPVA